MGKQVESLISIGFEVVGRWSVNEGRLVCLLEKHQTARNVLYTFVVDGDIVYIGKTFGVLKQRMRGYEAPMATQSTNLKNNRYILHALESGRSVDIVALADRQILSYGGFHLNIASGLEQSLINAFRPSWNGSQAIPVQEVAPERTVDVPDTKLKVEPAPVKISSGRKLPERGATDVFRTELRRKFAVAEMQNMDFLDIKSGDLHKELGQSNRMPLSCSAMRSLMQEGDEILESPPQGNGSRLVIRYIIPRRPE